MFCPFCILNYTTRKEDDKYGNLKNIFKANKICLHNLNKFKLEKICEIGNAEAATKTCSTPIGRQTSSHFRKCAQMPEECEGKPDHDALIGMWRRQESLIGGTHPTLSAPKYFVAMNIL